MVLLKVSGLSKKEKGVFTVKDISFTQAPLQKIAIAGETGSGKTTLLKMIAGLVQADAGELLFEQKKLKGPNDQLIPGHAGIAYLSQYFELRNNYWVHEILSYANELPQEAATVLYRVCRIEHLLQRRSDQLSGGEKQRIALARLLIGAPRLLLLDEPFSNLDAVHRSIVKAVIADINTRLDISCIMVSHDAPDILSWADTILVMKEGVLIQQGSPEQVYRQPVNAYCAGLFGGYNLINAADAAVLNPSFAISDSQQKILLRPEQLMMGTNGGAGLKGIVQNILFMGSYYSIEVNTGRQLVKINTAKQTCKKGDSIEITVTTGDAPWYIND
jgi:iron(III) transport system ATP-binding protein